MAKIEDIDAVCKRLSLGSTVAGRASNIISSELIVIPTGCHVLDNDLLIHGGLPCGQMTLIWGMADVGKSLTTYWAAANAQAMFPDKYVVIVDSEGRTKDITATEWMEKQGIDLNRLIILHSSHLEKILPFICTMARRDDVCLIIWDTYSNCFALPMDKDKNPDYTKNPGIGGVARAVSLAMPAIMDEIHRSNIAFVVVAQIRARIDMQGGGRGGNRPGVSKQLEHEAAVRLNFRHAETVTENQIPIGWKLAIRVEKGKGYATRGANTGNTGDGHITLLFNEGRPDNTVMLIEDAIKCGVIQAVGSWFSYKELKIQGRKKLKEALTDEMIEDITAELKLVKETMPAETGLEI